MTSNQNGHGIKLSVILQSKLRYKINHFRAAENVCRFDQKILRKAKTSEQFADKSNFYYIHGSMIHFNRIRI